MLNLRLDGKELGCNVSPGRSLDRAIKGIAKKAMEIQVKLGVG